MSNGRKIIRTLLTAAALAVAVLPCSASGNTQGAVHDHSFYVTMGILTERDMIMGFSDKSPNAGGTLVSFTEGALEMDDTYQNAVGDFYVYHITNLPAYSVKLSASPMRAYDKTTKELVGGKYKGYGIKMKSSPNTWEDVHFGSAEGPTQLVPAAESMDTRVFFMGNDYIFHGDENGSDRGNDDWWRGFRITVPLYSPGDEIDLQYDWKGSLTLTYEGV